MCKMICLIFSYFLLISSSQAAIVSLLCPDGSKMQESAQCAPDAGCWPAGVQLSVEGNKMKVDINPNGSIIIDDKYLDKVVKIQSGDNFWSPGYCPTLKAGILFNSIILKQSQTVTMNFRPR